MHFFMECALKRKLLSGQRPRPQRREGCPPGKFVFLEAQKCFFLHFLGAVS